MIKELTQRYIHSRVFRLFRRVVKLIHMSTYYFHILYFLLPVLVHSCSNYNFSCGNFMLEIKYPFFSTENHECGGLHFVRCMNLVPVVRLHGEGFLYPVWNISYSDNSLVIHDLKLSSYFRGSNCMFLYDFTSPVPRFNVSNVTEYLSSSEGFFNCKANGYDFAQDVFNELYGLASCKDYSLDYSNDMEDQSYCETSSGIWFGWRLAFDEDDGNVSLLSAGFSRKWTPFPDCFSCQIVAGNCSSQCRGAMPSSGHSNRKLVIGIICGLGGFLLACAICFRSRILFLKKKNAKHARTVEAFLEKHCCLATKRYTYSHVKKMTKSFKEKLGQGGYGSVYKGKLFDGRPVAVKVLSETKGNGEDFINEVAAIGNTSHVNVVSLRGFCAEGSNRALIYDFMPNGSLEKYISSEKLEAKTSLGWEKLYEIAVGIARGLEYLHRGCNTRIVHFDIKPHNILLDQDFCPKISDFGMAKLCHPKQSIISMCGTRGTIGYIAPEVFSRTFGVVSSKSDVYSYGMMMLEMFGGKNSMNPGLESTSEAYFPQSIYQHLNNRDGLVQYEVTSETEQIVRKMMIVGFWCIQTMPENRPSMGRVVEMLEGSIHDLPIPPKPILSSPLDLIAGSCIMSSST